MNKQIMFGHANCRSLGRNGWIHTSGIELTSHEFGKNLQIAPITSRGQVASGCVEFPKDAVVLRQLREAIDAELGVIANEASDKPPVGKTYFKDMTVEQALSHLYTDLDMLGDGSWVPDQHSTCATADMLSDLMTLLKRRGAIADDFEPEYLNAGDEEQSDAA